MLDRNHVEIDILPFQHDLLTGRTLDLLRPHAHHLLEDRQLVPGIPEALGRLRLLEEGQQLADFAQRLDGFLAHAQRHAPRRAEQIAQHRHAVALDVLEQQRRTSRLQGAIADLGHLQIGVHLGTNALEFALLFQRRDEIA